MSTTDDRESDPYDTGGPGSEAAPMVVSFPEPPVTLRAVMEQLQHAALEPPMSEEELRHLAQLPRPWDPATCSGRLRRDLWIWLDRVAVWINEQYLWNVSRPGVPECWPAHPHLVHELAVLACARYFTNLAVSPTALGDWQRYDLPSFLERLRDRLGEGCQPRRHLPAPRNERDRSYGSAPSRSFREAHFRSDAAVLGRDRSE